MSRLRTLVLVFTIMLSSLGGAFALTDNAAAAGTTDAWAGWGSYWFTGYANISCSGGCYGNLTVNIYWNNSWRNGNKSGYATWANKTISTSTYACGPSRFLQKLSVVASFSGGGYKRVDYWLYLNC